MSTDPMPRMRATTESTGDPVRAGAVVVPARRRPARGVAAVLAVILAGILGGVPAAAGQSFTFSTLQQVDFGPEFYPSSIELADVDLDGRVDAIVAGRNREGVMALLRGQADGLFGPAEFIEVGAQTTWVQAGDFDDDGDLDLLCTLRSRPAGIGLLRNQGDGTFAATERMPLLREPAVLRADDLDGDGRIDAVATNYFGDEVVVLAGTGTGPPAIVQRIPLHRGLASPARPFAMVLADLDDDGDRDAAVVHFASRHLAVLDNVSDAAGPRFGDLRLRRPATTAGVAATDRDGDGDVDLLLAQWGSPAGTLLILDNDGTGSFDASTAGLFGSFLWETMVADLDGDGFEDVIVSDALNAGLYYLRNNGPEASPAFGPFQFQFGFAFPRHVVPYDVDGDCALDLLVIDIASGRFTVLRNTTPQADGGCAGVDLDRDGVVDFQDVQAVLSRFGQVAGPADLDRDGRVDVFDLLEVTSRIRRQGGLR